MRGAWENNMNPLCSAGRLRGAPINQWWDQIKLNRKRRGRSIHFRHDDVSFNVTQPFSPSLHTTASLWPDHLWRSPLLLFAGHDCGLCILERSAVQL